MRAEKNSENSENKSTLEYIELFRYDFSKPPASLLPESIRRNMNHYLTDIKSLSTVSEEVFDKVSKKLEREMTKEVNQENSITDYGKELAEKFQELFPNSGSAIRFWGKITANQWQPRYLERKLW